MVASSCCTFLAQCAKTIYAVSCVYYILGQAHVFQITVIVSGQPKGCMHACDACMHVMHVGS